MDNTIAQLTDLFTEAREKNEFDFVLTLINYRGMGNKEDMTNLHEWFDSLEFYKRLYQENEGKEKTRMAALFYSTFFENSDFYNILGSLSRITLGFHPSSYLYWKTKKYERLLGTGEKISLISGLLQDASKEHIYTFFKENHIPEIRNSFFHSAYSITKENTFILHDSEPINVEGNLSRSFPIITFLYPKVNNLVLFFDTFKKIYLDSWASYNQNKTINCFFGKPTQATIMGSETGLKGWLVKNTTSFYGQPADTSMSYSTEYDMWTAMNLQMNFGNIESIEIREEVKRYMMKDDVRIGDAAFKNLIDKISERRIAPEINDAILLLVKFGTFKNEAMLQEQNVYKRKAIMKTILPFLKQAIELNKFFGENPHIILTQVIDAVSKYEKQLAE